MQGGLCERLFCDPNMGGFSPWSMTGRTNAILFVTTTASQTLLMRLRRAEKQSACVGEALGGQTGMRSSLALSFGKPHNIIAPSTIRSIAAVSLRTTTHIHSVANSRSTASLPSLPGDSLLSEERGSVVEQALLLLPIRQTGRRTRDHE